MNSPWPKTRMDKPLSKEKPQEFNAKANEEPLYNWSSLRSQYLAAE